MTGQEAFAVIITAVRPREGIPAEIGIALLKRWFDTWESGRLKKIKKSELEARRENLRALSGKAFELARNIAELDFQSMRAFEAAEIRGGNVTDVPPSDFALNLFRERLKIQRKELFRWNIDRHHKLGDDLASFGRDCLLAVEEVPETTIDPKIECLTDLANLYRLLTGKAPRRQQGSDSHSSRKGKDAGRWWTFAEASWCHRFGSADGLSYLMQKWWKMGSPAEHDFKRYLNSQGLSDLLDEVETTIR